MAEQALYTGRYKYYRVRINPLGCKGFYETSMVKALKIGKCLRVIPGKIGAQNNNNLYRYSPILFKSYATKTLAARHLSLLPKLNIFIARASTASTSRYRRLYRYYRNDRTSGLVFLYKSSKFRVNIAIILRTNPFLVVIFPFEEGR